MWISKQTLQSQKMLKITWNVKNCFGISNDFNAVIMVDIVDIIEIIDISKMLIDNLGIPVSRLSTRIPRLSVQKNGHAI